MTGDQMPSTRQQRARQFSRRAPRPSSPLSRKAYRHVGRPVDEEPVFADHRKDPRQRRSIGAHGRHYRFRQFDEFLVNQDSIKQIEKMTEAGQFVDPQQVLHGTCT